VEGIYFDFAGIASCDGGIGWRVSRGSVFLLPELHGLPLHKACVQEVWDS